MSRTNQEIARYMMLYSNIAVYQGLFMGIEGESHKDKRERQGFARSLLTSIRIYKKEAPLLLRQNKNLIEINELEKKCKSLLPECNEEIPFYG